MSNKRFVIGEAVKFGWKTTKDSIGFFIALIIVAFLIEIIPRVVGDIIAPRFHIISVILYLTATVLDIVVSLGLLKVSIKFCDGKKAKLDDLLSSFNLVLSYFAATLVYLFIVAAGMVLLVIPGLVWSIKYSLFPYFIVDKKLGPIEAIKASGKATIDAKFQLFLFGLLLALINFAGMLAFGIGIFVTIPLSLLAYAYVYRQLSSSGPVSDRDKKVSKGGLVPGLKGVMYINLES